MLLSDYIQNSSKTRLSPFMEALYQNEKNAKGMYDDDYDMRGYFSKYGTLDTLPSLNSNGHYEDTFKDPTHITFSTGSQYNNTLTSNGLAQGGRWEQANDGSWTFYASPYNLTNYTPQEMQDYFDKYEKGNRLVLPY